MAQRRAAFRLPPGAGDIFAAVAPDAPPGPRDAWEQIHRPRVVEAFEVGDMNPLYASIHHTMAEEATFHGVPQAQPLHLFVASIRMVQRSRGTEAAEAHLVEQVRVALGYTSGRVRIEGAKPVEWNEFTWDAIDLIDEADAAFGDAQWGRSVEIRDQCIVSTFLRRSAVRTALRRQGVDVVGLERDYGARKGRRAWPVFLFRLYLRRRWRRTQLRTKQSTRN